MIARLHSTILHEIARVIEARSKVPERIRIHGKPYQITYLEDHKGRLEEALRRHDSERLGMLFGQLQSKVKYQFMRALANRKKTKTKTKTVRAQTRRTRSTRGRSTRRRAARS
ncbi:MAG: hypothetical protein HYR72_18570 [Deltaproteobacteria bacterium]|nr:hypothetical protein [Deltaproteobacteria bacterium]MBI3386274.1 hypothetical protein [Deltaproteobacteria bacterium]